MALETVEGAWVSLVPALVAISLAWYTRDAIIGLFTGVAMAGAAYGALNPATVGVPKTMFGTQVLADPVTVHGAEFSGGIVGAAYGALFGLKVVPTIVATSPLFADAWYVENVLLAIFAIGALIGLMVRSGALQGVLEALADWADTPADAEKAAFLAGVIVHIDDYFNCLVVGSMMRPLTDKFDVSRAKLAYYVDSAGSPASRLAFYSTWGAAMVGFIGAGMTQAAKNDTLPARFSSFVTTEGGELTAVNSEIWPLFFNTLFTGFYSWVALAIAALVAWQVFPNIGEMDEEESRARAGDGVVGDDANPMISSEMDQYEVYEGATPDWRNFAIPILTMIAIGLGAMFWRPDGVLVEGGLNIGGVRLGLAATAAVVVAFVLYRLRGDIPSNSDGVDAMTTGMKGIFLAAAILTFASAIQNAVTLLGISSFVTDWFGGVPAGIVPVLLFLATAFISFSDGSSWSTYGIMFPIAIPVAFATGAPLVLTLGAVFSGGIFGDHCSPISDTTVLASSTSGSDHIVHVRTQIPYAVISATIAAILFLVLGFVLPTGFEIIPY